MDHWQPVFARWVCWFKPSTTWPGRFVDTMNRSLISELFQLHLGRAVGMTALQHIPPLKRRAMLEGMNPTGSLPRAMRA